MTKKELEKEITYRKAGWIKFSNKLLPRWDKESWTIWRNEKEGNIFFNFENAIIFLEILNLKKEVENNE